MPKEAGTDTADRPSNLRPRRSRKDRPCDHCRVAKRQCHIAVRGEPCMHCRKAGRPCSFNAPPLNRHRKASPAPSGWLEAEDSDGSPRAARAPAPAAAARTPVEVERPLDGGPESGLAAGTGAASAPGQPSSAPDQTSGRNRPSRPPHALPAEPADPCPSSFQPPPRSYHLQEAGAPLPHPPFPPLPSGPSLWMGEPSAPYAHHGPPRPAHVSAINAFLDSLDDEHAHSPKGHTEDDSHYNSLDMDVTEEEESHYLGSGAVAQLAVVSLDARIEARNVDSLPYRQVAERSNPAYFLKNPSRVYGLSNAAYVAEKAYQDVLAIVSAEDPTMPERLIQHFLYRTLPALPILNHVRFEASLRGWQGAGTFPYAVLVAIFGHSAIYEPALRRRMKDLFSIHLHVCDNEYRQPRLQLLQLEILNVTGRPILNPGGNHIAIARAVGVIQLLGLHRDCSRWKLPKWERSLRKRLWWALYVEDKWNAYTYGRPVNLEGHRSSIPQMTLDDGDWGKHGPPEASADIACFIALCRLSTILENLLPLLLDRDHDGRKSGSESVYRDLPGDLVFSRASSGRPARPGSRSLQLAHIGITTLICRLGLERDDFANATFPHIVSATKHALDVMDTLAVFLECLVMDDFYSYWSPSSAYQLTNAVTLLLQQAIRINQFQHPAQSDEHEPERRRVLADTFRLLRRLVAAIQAASEGGWEVADAATPRIKSLIKAMPPIPGIEDVQAMLAPVAAVAPPPDWVPGAESEPDADILALFDWLNGDRVF